MGSADIVVSPESLKNETSIDINTINMKLNSEDLSLKSFNLETPIKTNGKYFNQPKVIKTNVITHDKDAIVFYKISENKKFKKIDMNKYVTSYSIPQNMEFQGYLPLESNFKSVLINIQTKSIKIQEFIFYAKFIKINKVKEDKVEDFDDVPNFDNEDLIGEYDRINKKVLI